MQKGDLKHAVKVYSNAADRLLKSGQMDEMATLLEEILRIAPEEGAVKKKLDAIQTGRMEKRQEHIRLLRRSAVWITMFLIVIAWIVYDGIARREFADVVGLSYYDIQENKTGNALERLAEFRGSYPFTLAAVDAHHFVEQLRDMNGSR